MQDFKNLLVWQKSHNLLIEFYKDISNYPADERFSLSSQLKRALISIPANIAEGTGRRTRKDFAKYITIALGSLSEVEYYIILSKDLKYISIDKSEYYIMEFNNLKMMLYSLLKKLTS